MAKEFEELELYRRAVKCEGWQWKPGMLVMSDPLEVPRVIGSLAQSSSLRARVTSVVLGRWHGVFEYAVDFADAEHEECSGNDLPGTLPDFSDPGTLGCLEALVCELLGASFLTIGMHHSGGPGGTRGVGVWVERGSGARLDDGRTIREVSKGPDKASALVAALELGTLAR